MNQFPMDQSSNRYDLIMFDWNGTLSSGMIAKGEISLERITELFPGVIATLEALNFRKIKLGIATAASSFEMDHELQSHGIKHLFQCVYTAGSGPVKPNPFALVHAMEALNIPPEKTLMVGDTYRDILMAKNANVSAVGVSHGLYTAPELREAGADNVISEIGELVSWLGALS